MTTTAVYTHTKIKNLLFFLYTAKTVYRIDIYTRYKQYCKYSILFMSLMRQHCNTYTCRTIELTFASVRWVLYIMTISSQEQAPREQEKVTGTRDRREIYMKIERRIDRCILHKIDVSRIMRRDIFISRHVSAQLACARATKATRPGAINHFAWIYIPNKRKTIPSSERIFFVKKRSTLI